MGTLGCINDMLQRDKENRELRKLSKERLKETRNRLMKIGSSTKLPDTSVEEMKEIRKKDYRERKSRCQPSIQNKITFSHICLIRPPFSMAVLFSHQIRSHLSPPTVLTVKVSSSVPLPRPSFRRTLNTASPVRNFGEACTITL